MKSFELVAVTSESKIENLKAIHNGHAKSPISVCAVTSESKIENLKAIHNGRRFG